MTAADINMPHKKDPPPHDATQMAHPCDSCAQTGMVLYQPTTATESDHLVSCLNCGGSGWNIR